MRTHESSFIKQFGSLEKHSRPHAGNKLFLMLSIIQPMPNLENTSKNTYSRYWSEVFR
jgi:hypothetical protein